MFNPADFLTLAQTLSAATTDEARLRTSVSRSYYACFLSARERLAASGSYVPTGRGEDHYNVRRVLADTGYRVLSDQLLGLSRKRRTADYELGTRVSPIDAKKAARIAKPLITRIQGIA